MMTDRTLSSRLHKRPCLKHFLFPTFLFVAACGGDDTRSVGHAAFTPDDPQFLVVTKNEMPPLSPQVGSAAPEGLYASIDDTIRRGDDLRDPRFYGYAEGMVRKSLETAASDTGALLRLADLLQKQHDFAGSAEVYERVVTLAPANPQAYLSLAMLARQRGDFQRMEESCKRLLGRTEVEVAAICLYTAQGLQGKLEPSYAGLSAILERPLPATVKSWAAQEAAEMAARLGRQEQAETHWTLALQAVDRPVPPAELLAAIADFKRYQQAPPVVARLLAEERDMPALAMRLAAAEIEIAAVSEGGDAETVRAEWVSRLQPWVDQWAARGEQTHHGEMAFYLFAVRGEPERALPPAFAQWTARKEPQDTLLLLEIITELGASSSEASRSLQAVEQWLKQSGYEDQRLSTLRKAAS